MGVENGGVGGADGGPHSIHPYERMLPRKWTPKKVGVAMPPPIDVGATAADDDADAAAAAAARAS